MDLSSRRVYFISEFKDEIYTISYRTLAVLETDGNNIREPYSKFLGDGIYEVRVQQVNNIARVLYFFVVNKKIILTNGFIKKSQKTPKS
jgi:hypothetical protein